MLPFSDSVVEAVVEYHLDILEPPNVSAEKKLVIERAQNHLLDFTQHTWPDYIADPFHVDVCSQIDKLVDGELQYMMLFAPPQHGKSEIVSRRLPPYWLAKRPDMPVGLISYGASLALLNTRAAQAIFLSPQYKEIFPHMMKDDKNWRIADWHTENHRGYVLAAGAGGPITGHGFGLAIIDDPIENWAAAQSDTLRNSLWEWWKGTFKSRVWEFGSILFMMTRWHEDDLAARILDSEGRIEEGGKWKVLSYSALAEKENKDKGILPDPLGRKPGEALAPHRFSSTYLNVLRNEAPRVFDAEYQQRPTAPKGQLFKIGNVNYADATAIPEEVATVTAEGEILALSNSRRVQYVRFWDMAATEAEMFSRDPAYTVGTLMAMFDTQKKDLAGRSIMRPYVLHVERFRLAPEQVADRIETTAKLDGTRVKVRIEQEPGSAGKTVIAAYVQLLQGFDMGGIPATGKKEVRASPIAIQFNAGNIMVVVAPWNRLWLNELGGFPFGTHKDQVDSLSGAYGVLTDPDKQWRRSKFAKV